MLKRKCRAVYRRLRHLDLLSHNRKVNYALIGDVDRPN
jgi:hypothetical protein